ncbi:MAG TPA: sulfur carrier protein ThiS [Vicinamibacterales bacterium]|nr:sulfur carrier protein ThiS [Vicinamibacterales bacterium]
MTISLNGEPHTLDAPLTVSELLDRLGIDPRRVAVERNLIVVKRVLYPDTLIQEGDAIEIVNFVGGGQGGPRSFQGPRGPQYSLGGSSSGQ